jgi:hypothetical protein
MASPPVLSPFAGSIWDPSDDEWAEVDAQHIVSTFKASFKDPNQHGPHKSGALSRFGSTIIRYLPPSPTKLIPSSPTKLAQDATLKHEEALRDKLELLQNTYHTNPTGDLHDSTMRTVFLPGGSRYFTAPTTEPRQMHIIDLEAYFTSKDPLVQAAYPRLCDAIATILSHTTPACVEAFLNPLVGEFVYKREVERNKAGTILVLIRKGNAIVVSPRTHLPTTLFFFF